MDKFERLNRETRDYNNNKEVNRFSQSTPNYGSSEFWRNYWNNQTFKQNNGQYSRHYK